MTPNFPLRLFFSSEKHQISLEPLTFRLERGTSYVELQLHLFNIFYFKLDDARAKKESVLCVLECLVLQNSNNYYYRIAP